MRNISSTGTRIRIVLMTIALVTAGLVTAAATSSQAGTGHGRVLRFGVHFSPFNVIDVPPLQTHRGDYTAGDYTVFSDVLTDHAGRRVGSEAGTGTITRVAKSGAQIYYAMAIQLHGGQITGSGLGSPAPDKHLAVNGGTGSFTGAHGSILVVENGDGTGSLKLTLR
jgi:hypothetical protein